MKECKLRVRKSTIQYLLIYILIIVHDAQIYAVNTTIIRYGIILCAVLYCLLKFKLKQKQYVRHILFFTVFMCTLTLFHFDRSYFDKCLAVIEHLLIFFVAFDINREMFATRYIKIIVIISAISIPFFVVQCLAPDTLPQILSATKGWGDGYSWSTDFYGQILYTYRGTVAGTRNNAIFTEPGIFQMLLNAAIFILLFLPGQCHFTSRVRKYITILLTITVITTGSTTGYIAITVIYLVYISKSVDASQIKFRRFIFRVVMVGIMCLVLDYFFNQRNSILQTYVFDKFLEMDTVEYASGNARVLTMVICFQQIASHPLGLLTGVTYYKVNQALYLTNNIAAGCKIIPFITATGLPLALYLHWPYFISPLMTGQRIREKILCIFLYWNSALAQSREMYPALIMLTIMLIWDEKNTVYVQDREEVACV